MSNVINFPRTTPTGSGLELAQATLAGVAHAISVDMQDAALRMATAESAADTKAVVNEMHEKLLGHAAGFSKLADAVKGWR